MEKINVMCKMTPVEARRLSEMCFHISEEAHDDAECPEPWFDEAWWDALAHHIRDEMRQHGVSEEFIIGISDDI